MSVLYRVTFRKRFDREGEGADAPVTFLDLADGIVIDSAFVEAIEPDNLHGEDAMDEDDDFLSMGTEIWDFDVADHAQQEFKDALAKSGVVIEFDELEEEDDDIEGEVGGESTEPKER